MSTIPAGLTEAEVYAFYQKLLDNLNAQAASTTDRAAIDLLDDAAQAISDALSLDNEIALQASTDQFTALTPGMKKANDEIAALQKQIGAITAKISDVASIESAINQILGFAGKLL